MKQLEENLAKNATRAQYRLLDIAFSDAKGSAKFTAPPDGTAGHQTGSLGDAPAVTTVQTVTGDALVQEGEIPEPDVMKIDVEGAESLVLDGFREMLATGTCRSIYCEVHLPDPSRPSIETHGESIRSLRKKFNDLGFTVEIHDRKGAQIRLQATR